MSYATDSLRSALRSLDNIAAALADPGDDLSLQVIQLETGLHAVLCRASIEGALRVLADEEQRMAARPLMRTDTLATIASATGIQGRIVPVAAE